MKKFLLYLMAVIYVAAGINHFVHPHIYLAIMPPWLPAHANLVFISGLIEILLGILLVVPTTRRYAAWGIILLLIAVFPANIQMAINYYKSSNPFFWLTIARLPLQFVLMIWAYRYTKKNAV